MPIAVKGCSQVVYAEMYRGLEFTPWNPAACYHLNMLYKNKNTIALPVRWHRLLNIYYVKYIIMDKLTELLKEYQLDKGERIRLAGPDVEIDDKEEQILEATLISKKYGFIQWLYDNDKIDMEEVPDRMDSWGTDNSCDVPNILMNLAIKDNPLEYLVSILK